MKRGWLLVVIMVIAMGAASAYVATVAKNLYHVDDSGVRDFIRTDRPEDKYIRGMVEKGSFVLSEQLEGRVVFRDDAVVLHEMTFTAEHARVRCTAGDTVGQGDVLCENGENRLLSDATGLVLTVVENEESVQVSVLDMARSDILVQIPEARQKRFGAETVFVGSYDGESRDVSVSSVDARIEGNGFSVLLTNPFEVFENTVIPIEVTYEIKENAVIVPSEYIHRDTDGTNYVLVQGTSGELIKREVHLGEDNGTFTELINAESLVGKDVFVDKKELQINEQ